MQKKKQLRALKSGLNQPSKHGGTAKEDTFVHYGEQVAITELQYELEKADYAEWLIVANELNQTGTTLDAKRAILGRFGRKVQREAREAEEDEPDATDGSQDGETMTANPMHAKKSNTQARKWTVIATSDVSTNVVATTSKQPAFVLVCTKDNAAEKRKKRKDQYELKKGNRPIEEFDVSTPMDMMDKVHAFRDWFKTSHTFDLIEVKKKKEDLDTKLALYDKLSNNEASFKVFDSHDDASLAYKKHKQLLESADTVQESARKLLSKMAAAPIESDGFLKLLSQVVLALSDVDVVTGFISYFAYWDSFQSGSRTGLIFLVLNIVMWVIYIGGGNAVVLCILSFSSFTVHFVAQPSEGTGSMENS